MKSYTMKKTHRKAFEDAVREINAIPGVSLRMTSQLVKGDARGRESAKSSKLILEFETASRRTAYGFEMNPLNADGRTASSLGCAVEAYTKKTTAKGADALRGKPVEGLMDGLALAANASSYGELFEGYSCEAVIGPDGAEYANLNYSGISMQARNALYAVASDPDYDPLFDEIMENPSKFLSDDPHGFIAAYCGFTGAEYAKEDVSPAHNLAARQMLLYYKEDAGREVTEKDVRAAYGLDALIGAVRKAMADAKKSPGGNDYADIMRALQDDKDGLPDMKAMRALDGLNAMAAYREIAATAASVSDEKLTADRKTADALDTCNVIHPKGRSTNYGGLDAACAKLAADACYPKYNSELSGREGLAGDKIRRWEEYRLYRAHLLNADPYMPSGIPEAKIRYTGDPAGKIDLSKVRIMMPDGDGNHPEMNDVPYKDFAALAKPLALPGADSARTYLLKSMPFLEDDLRSGGDMAKDLVMKAMKRREGADTDLLCIDMDLFDKCCESGALDIIDYGEYRSVIDGASKARDGHFAAGGAAVWAVDHMAGIPSPESCKFEFGSLIEAGAGAAGHGRGILDDGTYMTAMAKSFRKYDRTAESVLQDGSDYAEALKNRPEFEAYRVFRACLDSRVSGCEAAVREKDADGRVKAGMKLNDFLVMTDCYRAGNASDILTIHNDIDAAYDDNADYGSMPHLYRPKNQNDVEMLRAALGRESAGLKDAMTDRGRDALIPDVMKGYLKGDPETAEAVLQKSRARMRQCDTYEHHPRYDVMKEAERAMKGAAKDAGRDAEAEKLMSDFEQFGG